MKVYIKHDVDVMSIWDIVKYSGMRIPCTVRYRGIGIMASKADVMECKLAQLPFHHAI